MINLSCKALSQSHVDVLSKGLSFVPTARYQSFNTKIELHKFIRKLRLRLYFRHNTLSSAPPTLAPPSSFIPPGNIDPAIDTYSKLIHHDVTKLEQNIPFVRQNITHRERTALNELQQDDSIAIRPADKGGAVVIQDFTDYLAEATRQLSDTTTYVKLTNDPGTSTRDGIKPIIDSALQSGCITKRDHRFLFRKHHKTPVLYLLPKVHKNITPCPGRPIVSGNESLLEPLSQYVDHHIQPFVKNLPAYIRDSSDFLLKLDQITLDLSDMILATLDIESLYTKIPQQAAIDTIRHTLSERSTQPPTNDFITKLAEIILRNNYFMFGGEYYLQISGVAMGCAAAPSVANLYVGTFEKDFIYNPAVNPYIAQISLWLRYIDDVFLLWNGTAASLLEFHRLLNTWNKHLQFTIEHSPDSIHFLDVSVYKHNNKLHSTIYRKPTDRNTLLHASSYHPSHLKDNLPVGQFMRLRRLCSNKRDFISKSADMQMRFSERGYGRRTTSRAFKRALHSHRDTLLEPRATDSTSSQRTTMTLQYSPLANKIRRCILKHWHILQLHDSFTLPPRIAFTRNPNIRNKLVKTSHFPSSNTQRTIDSLPPPVGHFPCAHCSCCAQTSKLKTFTTPDNLTVTLKHLTTCASQGVVYAIKCPCPLLYVGKTSRPLRTRITEHKSAIRRGDTKAPLVEHFINKSHSDSELRFWAIELIKPHPRGGDLDRTLLQREARWIDFLGTTAPNGLNEDFDLSCFL